MAVVIVEYSYSNNYEGWKPSMEKVSIEVLIMKILFIFYRKHVYFLEEERFLFWGMMLRFSVFRSFIFNRCHITTIYSIRLTLWMYHLYKIYKFSLASWFPEINYTYTSDRITVQKPIKISIKHLNNTFNHSLKLYKLICIYFHVKNAFYKMNIALLGCLNSISSYQ